jgi:hypothetical protein
MKSDRYRAALPFIAIGCIALSCTASYSVAAIQKGTSLEMSTAEDKRIDFTMELPPEIIGLLFSFLDPNPSYMSVNRKINAAATYAIQDWSRRKLRRIEKLMDSDHFIPLPGSSVMASISPIGVSQELWFEVMGNNPSHFKIKKFCPGLDNRGEVAHKALMMVKKSGEPERIEMCRHLPVERVKALSNGNKNSDEEFINQLNLLYSKSGSSVKFRRAKVEEWNYADTAGDTQPKRADDVDLWKYVTYWDISDKDPGQNPNLNLPSPSAEVQTHPVKGKQANSLGFYRNCVSEWTDDTIGSVRVDAGGSWRSSPRRAASGFRTVGLPNSRSSSGGASRLVRAE